MQTELNLATEGEPDMPRGKQLETHSWDIEQIRLLITLVVKYGLHDWGRVAREHNHHFQLSKGGRTMKALAGMFGRIRDGMMYLQDPEVMKMMEDNPSLWTKQERRGVGRPTSSDRMDKLELMMEKVLEAMTAPVTKPLASDQNPRILAGLPQGRKKHG